MELNGFYDEEELAEMLDRKEITRKEYITHHSAELLKQMKSSVQTLDWNRMKRVQNSSWRRCK